MEWGVLQIIPLFHTGHESPESPKLIFFLFGGIREVSLFFLSNRDELRVIRDSDTMSLRIFGGFGSLRLESRKNSLRLEITLEHAAAALRGTFILELIPPKHRWAFFITIVRENLANRGDSSRISVNSCPIRAAFGIFLSDS